mgnify:CR=1 FL=1
MDKYYVERLVGEKWFLKTNDISFEECKRYIKEHLKESPRSKYRIMKTHTDIVGEYTGSENTVPSKKILHCHICDKVMVKDEDPIYIHRREHGYYTTDTVCCSKECAISAAEYDIYKYSPEENDYEYRNAGWYYQEDDEL